MTNPAHVTYATIWVSDAEAPGKVVPVEAPVSARQFTSPLLDISFLTDLYVILLGPTLRQLLAYESSESSGEGELARPTSEQQDQKGRVLAARATEALASVMSKSPPARLLIDSLRVKSLAHGAFQIFEIGEELRKLLAALNEERGARIARDWNTLRAAWVSAPETEESLQRRAELLMELATLSTVSVADGGRLLLRLERLTKKRH